ncbi:hypothetical protein, partial [Citrobacter portucalensis]
RFESFPHHHHFIKQHTQFLCNALYLPDALRLSGLQTRYVPAICLLRCAYQAYKLDTCLLFA